MYDEEKQQVQWEQENGNTTQVFSSKLPQAL